MSRNPNAGMSGGRNPYANGYGDTGRANRYDGYGSNAYNNNPANSSNTSLNPPGSSGGLPPPQSRDRRPGGYGGFYDNGASRDNDASSIPPRSRDGPPPPRQQQQGPQQLQQQQSFDNSNGNTDWGRRPQGTQESFGDPNGGYGQPRQRPNGMGMGMEMNGAGANGPPPPRQYESNRAPVREPARPMMQLPQNPEDVLQFVQKEWDFMGDEEEFVPIQVGLQFMDSSTLGRAQREPEFRDTHRQLQMTLKKIVNDHYQSFSSSIPTYHKIQQNITNSQNRIRNLRTGISDAKSGFLTAQPELRALATSSQSYDDMLQLLGHIETIQEIPERLEARLSEKRYLAAIDVLQNGLKLVKKADLAGIKGLGDMRTYFVHQEQSITEILVEELHDHLYLKSPYCQDRWKSSSPLNAESEAGAGAQATVGNIGNWDKPIHQFLSSLDVSSPLTDDGSRNPEADTFQFIRVLIESLNKLGHLNVAVDRIEQRLPVELFTVVDKTSSEVDHRHPSHTRGETKKPENGFAMPSQNDTRGHLLTEFLQNLFAKFEAIAEGHRVVHEVIKGIATREEIQDTTRLASGFRELWNLYQSELRSLLHDYLATDGDSSVRTNVADGSSLLNRGQRDKNKRIFKLGDLHAGSEEMRDEEDELDEILRSSVPGLVSTTLSKSNALGSANRRSKGPSGTGHKLLIQPSVFNISLMLPPSLAFLKRLKELVPTDANVVMTTLTSFLDDFLINVFQPQLDEVITDLCMRCLVDMNAFTEDPAWKSHSPKPIFKGTVSFINLVVAFTRMIDSIPHDQNFTQLVINQIITYYEKCFGWYKAIVSRSSSQGSAMLKAAARFVEAGEIRDVTHKMWESKTRRRDLVEKETELLLDHARKTPIEPYDIISDPKNAAALSLLYNSMQWLVARLGQMRHITTNNADSSKARHSRLGHARRWTLVKPPSSSKADGFANSVYLPMTEESVIGFDRTLESLQTLGLTALFTLHVDIRCGIIHMIVRTLGGPSAAKSQQLPDRNSASNAPATPSTPISPASTTLLSSSYHHILPTSTDTPSTSILDLVTDLMSFETTVSDYVGIRERRYIAAGLGHLMDQAILKYAWMIGVLNRNGAARLGLDVRVLQQNLRNFAFVTAPTSGTSVTSPTRPTPSRSKSQSSIDTTTSSPEDAQADILDTTLPRSPQFFSLFLSGPDSVLAFAEKNRTLPPHQRFTYDELKVLIELCFSEGLKGENGRGQENREVFMSAKRGFSAGLLRLSEVMWDS